MLQYVFRSRMLMFRYAAPSDHQSFRQNDDGRDTCRITYSITRPEWFKVLPDPYAVMVWMLFLLFLGQAHV